MKIQFGANYTPHFDPAIPGPIRQRLEKQVSAALTRPDRRFVMDHTDRDIQLDFKPARHMASPMGDRDEVVISARLVPSEQRQVNPNRDKSFTSLEIPVDARTVEELPGRDLPLLPTNPHVELLTAGRLTSDKATSIALFEGTMDVLMGRVAWLDGAMKRARYFNN